MGQLTTLYKNDPWTLLYNFYYQGIALECPSGHFLEPSAQKVPLSDLPRTQNCLRSWSKHVDMKSQIEALDELNNLEYKKERKTALGNADFLT